MADEGPENSPYQNMEQQMAANKANAPQDKNLYQLAGKHRKESDKRLIDMKA